MKLSNKSISKEVVFGFKESNISKVEGLSELLVLFSKRISISYSSHTTVNTYRRSIRDISLFHGCLPGGLEVDEILDYLHHLKEKGLSWAKIKLDVAALKYFFREMLHDELRASYIPYPKSSVVLLISKRRLKKHLHIAINYILNTNNRLLKLHRSVST